MFFFFVGLFSAFHSLGSHLFGLDFIKWKLFSCGSLRDKTTHTSCWKLINHNFYGCARSDWHHLRHQTTLALLLNYHGQYISLCSLSCGWYKSMQYLDHRLSCKNIYFKTYARQNSAQSSMPFRQVKCWYMNRRTSLKITWTDANKMNILYKFSLCKRWTIQYMHQQYMYADRNSANQ